MSYRADTVDEEEATADTAGGRLKVPATMLAEPATCLTSVVNSEINSNVWFVSETSQWRSGGWLGKDDATHSAC